MSRRTLTLLSACVIALVTAASVLAQMPPDAECKEEDAWLCTD